MPYDLERLIQAKYRTDLIEMAECEVFAPYTRGGSSVAVKNVRWSTDGKKIAISKLGVVDGQAQDLIHILDISECVETPPRLDEFPGKRFQYYDRNTAHHRNSYQRYQSDISNCHASTNGFC